MRLLDASAVVVDEQQTGLGGTFELRATPGAYRLEGVISEERPFSLEIVADAAHRTFVRVKLVNDGDARS
ncbi:MAG: hypothetical protein ABR599_08195 [Gemmatimonadota bacterium]